jgi:hypothetical protein
MTRQRDRERKLPDYEDLFPDVLFFQDSRQQRCGLKWIPAWGGLLHPFTIVYRQFWFYDFAPHALTTTHREIRRSLRAVLRARRVRRDGGRALADAAASCVTAGSQLGDKH